MTDWKHIDEMTKAWIKEAGEQIRESLKNTLEVSSKSNANDLVTNVDRETELFFIKKIRQTFPSHRILGEEGGGDEIEDTNGIIWVIDPIDGTMNFVHMNRNFAISIGVFENGKGKLGYIYDVIRDELFSAQIGEGAYLNGDKLDRLQETSIETAIIGVNPFWLTNNMRIDYQLLHRIVKDARGTRSIGSAALEMASVAAGWFDAYIALRLSPWDFAGGWVIVEELGGKVTRLDGKPLSILEKSSLLVAKPGIHETIIQKYLNNFVERKE